MNYFGTDGIRGKFGEYPIHPEFLIKLGYVIGNILLNQQQENSQIKVVIGKDTRLSGDIIESCLQAGLNASGVDVCLLGVVPTPAIAHLTQSFQAAAGIVISASHNPFFDNGIKLFSALGKKISDEMQTLINQQLQILNQQTFIIENEKLGKSYPINDAQGRYIEFCKATFPRHLNLTDITLVLDCANGANSHIAPQVFQELGAKVICLANQPNGMNINQHCGSTHPESLQQAVIDYQADLGIAFDGDGDRVIMVNEYGQLVDGDAILYILSTQNEQKPTAVVGTFMSNMGLQLALAQQNIDFHRAKVGDRHVMQTLDSHGLTLGGESSGHILCLDKANTGDAIVASLQVLAIMAKNKLSLSKLTKDYQQLPQKLVNVRLQQPQDPYQNPILVEEFTKASQQLQGRGRLLIRQSGTEPLIRVMVESDDEIECDLLANQLAGLIKSTMD